MFKIKVISDLPSSLKQIICLIKSSVSYAIMKTHVTGICSEKNLHYSEAMSSFTEFDDVPLEVKSYARELETVRKYKMAGARIRSRARWVKEGEKPSHYFCSLESRNFVNNVIPRIEKENGDTISNQFDILKETKDYFKNLYRNIDDTIQNVNLEKEISETLR